MINWIINCTIATVLVAIVFAVIGGISLLVQHYGNNPIAQLLVVVMVLGGLFGTLGTLVDHI